MTMIRAPRIFSAGKLRYSQEEISALIREKSGIDFGEILDLVPVERGESGRLVRLKIVGTKKTLTVGKELEIRRWLSNSHLYSAAFIVEKQQMNRRIPGLSCYRVPAGDMGWASARSVRR